MQFRGNSLLTTMWYLLWETWSGCAVQLTQMPTSRGKFSLKCWEYAYASVHLHVTSKSHPGHVTHTYCSEVHASLSTIDHNILTPNQWHILHHFCTSRFEEGEPLNLSDRQLLLSDYSHHLQLVSGPDDHVSNTKDKQPTPNWNKLSKEDILTINIRPTWTHIYHLSISQIQTSFQNNLILSTDTYYRPLPTSCSLQPLRTFPQKHFMLDAWAERSS